LILADIEDFARLATAHLGNGKVARSRPVVEHTDAHADGVAARYGRLLTNPLDTFDVKVGERRV
jgi:hypothetical protein